MPDTLSGTFVRRIYDCYDQYREPALTHRRFKHKDILPLLHQSGSHPAVGLFQEGYSAEGRKIYRIKTGTGRIQVLLWSQMHGDEATATMALFDVIKFLTADDEYNDFRSAILENLTLHMVPMLNPDAADRFQRHTPAGIDMNRDARQLQCPESRLLKRLRDDIDADFGFNLHDQSTLYSAGDTPKSSIIAFLAPAYDETRNINPVRKRSMQLIARLNEVLQEYIPGHVATYSDEFEPRAFGDNIQKWGSSTILVESGGMKGDPEKQHIRKLNFLLLLESFRAIARSDYENKTQEQYEAIPPNRFRLYDVIFRNIIVPCNDHELEVDLAINRNEINSEGATGYYEEGVIGELGDLAEFNGYEEWDGKGLRVVAGRVYSRVYKSRRELNEVDAANLVRQGYTAVRMKEPGKKAYTDFPLNIVGKKGGQPSGTSPGCAANLVFYRGEEVAFAVINGFVVDGTKADESLLQTGLGQQTIKGQNVPAVGNALVYR